VIKPEYTQRNYVNIDSQYFEPVINGMQQVVENGTAAASKIPGIVMCGKTGTADNSHGEPHSVFVAFAPRDNPKIAVAVVVENSGQGAQWAAPIASFIVEKYLTDSISVRPSGINPEYFMNANRLPDLSSYGDKLKAKPVPKDTLNKMGIDTSDKKETQEKKETQQKKSAGNRNSKVARPRFAAVLPERRDNE
jgi:penicillin-binding protein 2